MNSKQQAADCAAQSVRDGMVIGLGTGSTADCFIHALADLQQQGLDFTCVASSVVSQRKARALNLPLQGVDQIEVLDLYVDGADEVSPDNELLKGQGADLVREKLLATACERFLVLVDESKLVQRIGDRFPIPLEVMPMAWQMVQKQLRGLGAAGDIRTVPGKDNPMLSSHGSLIMDMVFPSEYCAAELNDILNAIPGVVEHGIFSGLTDTLIIGTEEGVTTR